MSQDVKLCPRCGVVKHSSEFYPDPKRKSGLASWCCDCCRRAARERLRKRKGQPLTGKIARARPCDFCGYSFTAAYDGSHVRKRFCSSVCRNASFGIGAPINSCRLYWWRCRDCAKVFKLSQHRTPGQVLCDRCRPLARQRVGRDINRRKNSVRRGAGKGDYKLSEVGDRDGWKCHLCGRKVLESLSGMHKWGPTIDHLIPVSAGGLDEIVNVALAHRHCNVVRSNKGPAQLRLLP